MKITIKFISLILLTTFFLMGKEQLIKPNSKEFKRLFKNKNIMFIVLDASRWDHFSFNNYFRKTTPNIDKIAERSIIFKNTFCQAAYTLASTGTLLTGLSPEFHNVTLLTSPPLSNKIQTIAELFKKKRYKTIAISGNPNFGKALGYDRGFDIFIDLYSKSLQVLAEEFINPFKEIIKKHKNEKMFLYLHIREPHRHFLMPSPFLGTFQNKFKNQSNELINLENKIKYSQKNNIEDIKFYNSLYDENLRYADYIVGKLINIMKTSNIFKKTIIFIFADHGESLGEHNLIGHGNILYNEVSKIPFILHIPELNKKLEINDIKITSDIFITLVDFYNLNYKYKYLSYGKNLFLLNKKRVIFTRGIEIKKNLTFAVIQYPYKLLITFPSNNIEMYNINYDFKETRNIKSQNPIILKKLILKLQTHLKASRKITSKKNKAKFSKEEIKALKSLGYL